MELPNFLNKFTQQQQTSEKEYFWALQLWDGGVKTAIWTVEEERTKVVALGSQEVWQESIDDLVVAIDRSLSIASERFLGLGKEPSKVIFGLPHDWLEEEKIISSRQQMLQTICEQLELSPLGFVLITDALNHHLQDVEGVPPSGILVNPQKNQVSVAVLEIGKVKGVEKVSRSENLAEDVYEGLLRFTQIKTLPSRLLLFNGEDMESARQILLDFPWPQKLPFLHFPKIEILPQDFDIHALCLAGGSEVAKSLGFKVEKEVLAETAGFGFVRGKDIREEVPEKEEAVAEESEEKFVEEKVEPEVIPVGKKKNIFLPIFFLKEKLAALSWPSLSSIPLLGFFLGGILIILIIGILGFIWYLPRAEVIIYVAPKLLEKEFQLTVDPNQEVIDETNLILPGRIIEVEASGEKSGETTGQKTVGEKAKGEVTIFNIGGAKNLDAGTILSGPGGLEFTLDESTTVASGSALGGPGQAKVPITAAEIGADYNLAGGSEFNVANFEKSILAAKNDSVLSGGTSRQIQAVSEEDQKNLAIRLTEELKDKAKSDLSNSIPPGRKLIEGSISTKESSRNFNHKVGEEASNLTLSMKVKVKALTFVEDEFSGLIEKQITNSIPADYEAKKEETKFQFEPQETKLDGGTLFKVSISANLLPKIDNQTVIKNIKGKNPQAAKEYLAQLPGYLDSEIEIKPSWIAKFLTLPRMEKNITLEMKSR